MSTRSFDDSKGIFFALVEDEENFGLRPTFADASAGWGMPYGGADRGACLDDVEQHWIDIEQHWTDIGPKSLRERL